MDKNIFYGEGWNFCNHDAAEGVGDAGVDADEGEGGIMGVVLIELNRKTLAYLLDASVEKWQVKYLGELFQIPFVIFAWVVAREVGGSDIRDCFGVDAYDL